MSVLLLIFIICASTVLSQESMSSPEHYCYVKSPIDSSFFNLTTIQHDHSDSIIRIGENEHLRVHFCQPLKEPCNGKQHYAVCLHTDATKEIGVGKEPPQVAIEFGKIMFRYTGDKCNESHFYTVDIEMKCNFSMKEKVAADLDIVYNHDQCGFQMALESSAACPKRKQTICDMEDKSGYYNLSPLTNLESNYKIKINDTVSVILNVCHSLLYGEHFHECDHDTMVCLVGETKTEEKRYKRIGDINSDERIYTVNGIVYFDLTSDTPCHEEEGNGLKTIKTTIEFVCNEFATTKLPKYRSGFGTCHYKFRWQTIVACSEAILINHSQLNRKPCKITDPIYSQIYDLSMLEGKVFYSNSSNRNAEYQFSICSSLRQSNCTRPGTAVCKYIKDKKFGVSEGLVNTRLSWKRGRIYLNYTDGMACGNNRRKFTTIIFYCGETDSLLIDDEDPCITIITWTTVMVCNRRCATSDYKINLDKLGRHSENYIVRDETNSTQYHLNVCEPLVNEQYGANCTNGAGICKVVNDEEGKRISELNLGYADSGVRRAKDGRVYLRYLNGSTCEEDSNKKISTEITFLCDIEVNTIGQIFFELGESFLLSQAFVNFLRIYQGKPTFKSYNNCKYEFDWKTGFSCDTFDARLSMECIMTNKLEIFDLSVLVKNSIFKVNRKESVGYFNVSVCGNTKKCNGTFVCNDKNFYGKNDKTPTRYTKHLIVFRFENGTKCKNNIFYKSVIKLWCDVWGGLGESFLINEGECDIDLDWTIKNPICIPKEKVTVGEKGTDNAKKPASPATVVKLMFVVVSLASLIVLILHFRYPYRRALCMNVMRYYINKYILCRREPQPTENLSL